MGPATAGEPGGQPAEASFVRQDMQAYKLLFEKPLGDMWEDAPPPISEACRNVCFAMGHNVSPALSASSVRS